MAWLRQSERFNPVSAVEEIRPQKIFISFLRSYRLYNPSIRLVSKVFQKNLNSLVYNSYRIK